MADKIHKVASVLKTTASSELDDEVAKELEVEDPANADKALAKLTEAFDELHEKTQQAKLAKQEE